MKGRRSPGNWETIMECVYLSLVRTREEKYYVRRVMREKNREGINIDGKEASDTFSSSIGSFVSPLQNRAKRTLEKSRGCLGSLEASRSRLLITDSRRCYTPSFKITAVNSKKNRHVMANRSGRGSSPRRIREETRPDPPSPSLSLFDPCSNLVRIPTHKPLEVITDGRPRASPLSLSRERERGIE